MLLILSNRWRSRQIKKKSYVLKVTNSSLLHKKTNSLLSLKMNLKVKIKKILLTFPKIFPTSIVFIPSRETYQQISESNRVIQIMSIYNLLLRRKKVQLSWKVEMQNARK